VTIRNAQGDRERRLAAASRQPAVIGLLDDDSGWIRVLAQRVERAGWSCSMLDPALAPSAAPALGLRALVVDPRAFADGDGYLATLRGWLTYTGVVVCTRPVPLAQRVSGLQLGADDWVTKPCHPEEVMARVAAVVRRRRAPAPWAEHPPVHAGELEIRADRFQAFVLGESAGLTPREFEVLKLLALGAGRVLDREDIYEQVWGYDMVRGDRSVDVFVRKLRQKLERVSPGWRYIHTQFGVGYRFAPEPERADHPPGRIAEVRRAPTPELAHVA
jgi:DNA-binding response OmpR family regulator